MMASLVGKIIPLWDQNFEIAILKYCEELIFFTLWTYVFPIMACLMGIIIPLWDQ